MLELLGELSGPHLRNNTDISKDHKIPKPRWEVSVPGLGRRPDRDVEYPKKCQRLIEQVIGANEEAPGKLRQYAGLEVPYVKPPEQLSLREEGITEPAELSKYLRQNPIFKDFVKGH